MRRAWTIIQFAVLVALGLWMASVKWPGLGFSWWWLLLYVPFLIVAAAYLITREDDESGEQGVNVTVTVTVESAS